MYNGVHYHSWLRCITFHTSGENIELVNVVSSLGSTKLSNTDSLSDTTCNYGPFCPLSKCINFQSTGVTIAASELVNGVCFINGRFYLSQGDIFSAPIAVTAGASSFTSALHSMSPTPFSKYLVSFLGCDTESACSWIFPLWYATSTNLPFDSELVACPRIQLINLFYGASNWDASNIRPIAFYSEGSVGLHCFQLERDKKYFDLARPLPR